MPGLGIGPGTAFRQDVLAARPPAVPSLQGVTFATVSYQLYSSGGSNAPILRTESLNVTLTPGQPIPDEQTVANLIGQDCLTKYGGQPDRVTIDNHDYIPESS